MAHKGKAVAVIVMVLSCLLLLSVFGDAARRVTPSSSQDTKSTISSQGVGLISSRTKGDCHCCRYQTRPFTCAAACCTEGCTCAAPDRIYVHA
ncbi:hypothetical protein SOVF_144110 [Spinacia oleracea]|nr:hypothetical protein SOVF_144110 [Spinacia oleracea]